MLEIFLKKRRLTHGIHYQTGLFVVIVLTNLKAI